MSAPALDLVQHDGWWWPASDVRARPVILRDVQEATDALLKHVEGRTCAVQAGGNVGVYPLELANHFRRVITFEPDRENVACMWRNLDARDTFKRVDARQAALGEAYGRCVVEPVEPDNCGAHRIRPADEGAVMLAVDDLDLIACDLIWLDIEGYELPALRGAEQTIRRFSPVVCVEDKGLSRAYGVEVGEAGEWLAALEYREVARIGRDKVYRRT